MAVYELVAFSTERYDDVRYRYYTSSKKMAEAFDKVPKIQFTDSGHGIVFNVRTLVKYGKRKSVITGHGSVEDWINTHTGKAKRHEPG
jgi:hypothetical protein